MDPENRSPIGLPRQRQSLHQSLRRPRLPLNHIRLNGVSSLRSRDIPLVLHEMEISLVTTRLDGIDNAEEIADNCIREEANNAVVEQVLPTMPIRSSSFRNAIQSSNGPRRDIHRSNTSIVIQRIRTNPSEPSINQPNDDQSYIVHNSIHRILSSTFCTFGLFSLSRFALLTVKFGVTFLLQFLVLSMAFGIPLFWLFACIGSATRANSLSMWRISPICKGIGIAALLIQVFIAIYASIFVGWTLIYFKDALAQSGSSFVWHNGNFTIADYLRQVTLLERKVSGVDLVSMEMLFSMVLVWFAVIIVSCENTRKRSCIKLGLIAFAMISLFLISIKFSDFLKQPIAVDVGDFLNHLSWFAALQETFNTWALFGSSVITTFGKQHYHQSVHFRRDVIFATCLTCLGLLITAILANLFIAIVNESWADSNAHFILEANFTSAFITTELFPITLSSISPHRVSKFWTFLGFGALTTLGIGQLYAIWLPLITLIQTLRNAVILSGIAAAIISFPLTTRFGVRMIHFFETTIGCSWIVPMICLAQLLALFLLRGRPYSADYLVRQLQLPQFLAIIVAVCWNIVCPMGLITLAIQQIKIGGGGRDATSDWPDSIRMLSLMVQIGVVLIVPLTAIVQVYRYLSIGPADIFDRIKELVRPEPLIIEEPDTSEPNSTTTSYSEATAECPNPPRYTPPPSYSTATGARLARAFRNSIRKSIRRIGLKRPTATEAVSNTRMRIFSDNPAQSSRLKRCLSLNRNVCKYSSLSRLRRTRSFSHTINPASTNNETNSD